jgi:nitrite reductase (cytochrome c-552)
MLSAGAAAHAAREHPMNVDRVITASAVTSTLLAALLAFPVTAQSPAMAPAAAAAPTITDDTSDPAVWGKESPAQYESYLKTAEPTRTRFGGHGGSEALPEEKIERDPWLKRMFLGYAFAIDYRDRRGHAFMLSDQEQTKRLTKPQTGSCLHCHATVMPLYRELGQGDATKGMLETYKFSYQELNKKLHDTGHAYAVSCGDCHDPDTMKLRVTRPGFMLGIREFAASDAPAAHLPSVVAWRAGKRDRPYDPNALAKKDEMRTYVCAQCHVEYYCSSKSPLDFPWRKGLRADDIEADWNDTKFADGARFFDYQHAETGAPILKAQHPEFELWSQGPHAANEVACADCHMPKTKVDGKKVSDHWVRSPLLNIENACLGCHEGTAKDLAAKADRVQSHTRDLMLAAARDLMGLLDQLVAAKAAGATPDQLKPAQELQRQAQWRLDFIAAENSMGFHAPAEAARVLKDASALALRGQQAAKEWNKVAATASR